MRSEDVAAEWDAELQRIGARVRELREAAGLTQQQVAEVRSSSAAVKPAARPSSIDTRQVARPVSSGSPLSVSHASPSRSREIGWAIWTFRTR